MGWLAPVWLLGLLALAVPVVLHLRRRRIGRRILVGSVRHLEGSAPPRTRRLAIRDPWLLALRLAVLTAAILALAEPFINAGAPRPETWVLAAPGVLADSAAWRRDPFLDSLARSGVALRQLGADFRPAAPGPSALQSPPADLWSLLADADARLPPGSRIIAVVPPERALIHGIRPRVSSDVLVHPVPPAVPASWIAAAWATGDSATVVTGRARDGGVARELARIGAGPRAARLADTAWRITEGGDTAIVPVLKPLAFRIVASEGRREDARYLGGAVTAVAGAMGLPLSLDVVPSQGIPGPAAGWTAALGVTPPAAPRDRQPGTALFVMTSAHDSSAGPATIAGDGSVIDRFGRQLLTHRRVDGISTYTYAGRFDPAAGGIGLDPEFPELVARLWAAPAAGLEAAALSRHLAVAAAQLTPARGTGTARSPAHRDLERLLLAVAALLFLVERAVAHRLRK